MKKILLSLAACLFLSANAFAGVNIGISGAFTSLETDGTETTKSSGELNTKSEDERVIVPSVFVEFQRDNGFAIGIDYVPAEAELGSGTGSDDDAETSGANKASAEIVDHFTVYALMPFGDQGAYFKAGVAQATIDTTETLATGTTYGNEDVNGIMVGIGVNRTAANGAFFRTELTRTDYEEVTFLGSFNGNAAGDSAVRNKVDASVDATALRISVGKSF